MAMLPPLNGSERRAVLYAGQEKSISVLGVIKTVIVCVKKQVKLDRISNSYYLSVLTPDSSLLEKWREIFKRIISETAISSILNYSNN